jgi:ATP-dependent DNA helicase RecQ
MDSYGAFKLTDKCRPLLRGEESIELRKDNTDKVKKKKSSKSAKLTKSAAALPEEAQPLWEALRALRKQLAADNGIPPFTVFHDSTMIEMINSNPTNKQELLTISGVGLSKLDKYGEQFLAVIAQFNDQ